MSITIKFGPGNAVTKELPRGTTIGQVLSDPNIKAVLGFGDNVEGRIGNVGQEAGTTLEDGDVVAVTVRANTKGA